MNLRQAYYELRFEIAFRSAKGDAFQTFFMGAREMRQFIDRDNACWR